MDRRPALRTGFAAVVVSALLTGAQCSDNADPPPYSPTPPASVSPGQENPGPGPVQPTIPAPKPTPVPETYPEPTATTHPKQPDSPEQPTSPTSVASTATSSSSPPGGGNADPGPGVPHELPPEPTGPLGQPPVGPAPTPPPVKQ